MITVFRFTASWCQPCKTLALLFETLAQTYNGRVVFKTIDVDEQRDLAEQHTVRNVPTVLFFDADGESSGRLVGVKPRQDYIDAIDIRLAVEEKMKNHV